MEVLQRSRVAGPTMRRRVSAACKPRPAAVVSSIPHSAIAAATVTSASPMQVALSGAQRATGAPGSHAAIQELDPKSFYDFISSSDGICVIDYYTDWCGPCQLMHKELDKLTSAFKGVKFGKLNCGACEEFSTRQRIRALPTFRLYYKGTCLDEITGAKPVQLRQLLTHYLFMTKLAP